MSPKLWSDEERLFIPRLKPQRTGFGDPWNDHGSRTASPPFHCDLENNGCTHIFNCYTCSITEG